MMAPYLRLDGITKRFGSFVANDRISFDIQAGSIHAVLGENGAGKTTLMTMLCGLYQPDAGQIYLQGQPLQITSPNVALQHGIGMIHQHFMLVPQLSVVENIILGTGGSWRLNLRQKAAEIADMAAGYGLAVDPWARVGELPVGTQQRVEILKALYRRATLLILDEPTAVLTPVEVERFFTVLRQLAAQNHTIIFISHKLDEVMRLCDAVTVLRRGQVVASTTPAATTPQELAQLMVGRPLERRIDQRDRTLTTVILEANHLTVQDDRGLPAIQDVSFQLHAGEILGVAGVDGNGQRELADEIAGLRPIQAGTLSMGQSSNIHHPPTIGYIPEDRQTMGLILRFSIARNLILKTFRRSPFCRRGLLRYGVIQTHAESAMADFDIRATSPQLKVSQLSGGNQQKVVLARELAGQPDLIIAMQPTRGLDVGATEAVQAALLAERNRGAAILYISTELDEIMAMSDRIAVLYNGQFVAILPSHSATVEAIGALMTGGQPTPLL